MSWDVPFALGGPVLRWEFIRAFRRPLPKVLCGLYVAWVIAVAVWGLYSYPRDFQAARLATAQASFLSELMAFLFYQQLVVMALVTPAVVADAIGREKEQDTLAALFGTQLGPREIVAGKLLGRLTVLGLVAVPGIPLILLVAMLSGLGVGALVLALAQTAVLTFTLAAGSMLLGVWTRRASDSILASYSTVVVAGGVGLVLFGSGLLPEWLAPVRFVQRLLETRAGYLGSRALWHLEAWGAFGLLCLILAVVRLAPAMRRQSDQRVPNWMWMLRPAVGNDPVRWRERHILGLAPLPALRMIPGWAGLLGVFVFSSVFALDTLEYAAGGLYALVREGHFDLAANRLRSLNTGRIWEGITTMGVILLFLGPIILGVRCSGSVAEEKRRKTWDDLLLTPLSLEEILRSKTLGVLQAAVMPLIAYTIPMFALGALVDVGGLFGVAVWVLVVAVAMIVGATFGASGALKPEDYPSPAPLYLPTEALRERRFAPEAEVGDGMVQDPRRVQPDHDPTRPRVPDEDETRIQPSD